MLFSNFLQVQLLRKVLFVRLLNGKVQVLLDHHGTMLPSVVGYLAWYLVRYLMQNHEGIFHFYKVQLLVTMVLVRYLTPW